MFCFDLLLRCLVAVIVFCLVNNFWWLLVICFWLLVLDKRYLVFVGLLCESFCFVWFLIACVVMFVYCGCVSFTCLKFALLWLFGVDCGFACFRWILCVVSLVCVFWLYMYKLWGYSLYWYCCLIGLCWFGANLLCDLVCWWFDYDCV